MKTGVSTTMPRGVASRPRRAAVVGQARRSSDVSSALGASGCWLAAGSSTIGQPLAGVATERAAVLQEPDRQATRCAQVRAAALAVHVSRRDPRTAVAL